MPISCKDTRGGRLIMGRQKIQKIKRKTGLFLFFVAGLFLIQIAFAFTIHGDIGPQTQLIPGCNRPASPVLIGRIESLVTETRMQNAGRISPEGAFAPASKKLPSESTQSIARIDTRRSNEPIIAAVSEIEGDRYYKYEVQSGDTLERISRRLFGNSQMVGAIVRINRIRDEKALRLGQSIMVPRAGILETVKVH